MGSPTSRRAAGRERVSAEPGSGEFAGPQSVQAVAAGSAVPAPSTDADLWSLPVETAGGQPGEEDGLLAWMSLLGQEEQAAQPPPWGTPARMPQPTRSPRSGPIPMEVGAGVPEPRRRSATRPGWAGLVVAVGVSALVGAACLVVVAQLTGRGVVGPDLGVPTDRDNRVVVPGPSAGCLTMLVKPLPDGSTAKVPGTCFVVG